MSKRNAINAFCRECIYDQGSKGSWIEQVTSCTSFKCPLYGERPITKGAHREAILKRASGLIDEEGSELERSMALV